MPDKKMYVPLLEIKDTGTIYEIKKGIVKIIGLSTCINGQLVELGPDLLGMVISFNERNILALVLGDETRISIGDTVYGQESVVDIPVGENFIGRVVNSLGRPIDSKGKIQENNFFPLFREAPGVVDRAPINEPLLTGIKIIDTVIPLGKGQRELIVGDRVTGKTSLAIDTILNQKTTGVICIFCWIGGSYSAFLKILGELKREGAMDYTLVVSAAASSSPAEQYIVPYTAAVLGEYFMQRGRDVLVVYDNLTRHAWIYRQISLLLERFPGREAYPGDIFYLHSQLMERAAKLNEENGGGSMSFLPIVETQEGDITGIIPSNLISMTDGQIYLDAELFHGGFKPAIDLTLSVSRIGSKVQCEAIKEVASMLKREYAWYKDLVSLTRVRTKLTPEVTAKLKRGKALSSLFLQDRGRPLALEEEIIIFYAFSSGVAGILEEKSREKFKKEIYRYLLKEWPQLIKKLASEKVLTEEMKKELDEAFHKFFKA